MRPLRLALVGLGEQTRLTHLPCIEYVVGKGIPLQIVAAADTRVVLDGLDQASRAQLEGSALIEVTNADPYCFGPADAHEVVGKFKDLGVNAALIASEPLSHGPYIQAFEEARVVYHVDKPLICRPGISIDPNTADYAIDDLLRLVRSGSPHGSVNVSRRFDPLARRVHALLRETTASTGDAVTNISAYYSDGESRTVEGCLEQEQHPFKYGYGALNHSGYHAVDTAVWLADLDTLPLDSMSIAVQCFSRSVRDYLAGSPSLAEVNDEARAREALDSEYDCTVNISVTAPGRGRTLLSLSIVHHSVSNRRWHTPRNANERLHLGRLSDELTTITQGESQRVFLRTGERPMQAIGEADQLLPVKTFYADVVRSPLYAESLKYPVHEVLMNDVVERRTLQQSNKLRSFMGFVDKFYDGHGTEIAVENHALTQLVLLLAARSVAEQGRAQVWPSKEPFA